MPTVLITGTSTGFGHVTAELLAARGWRVFASMRDLKRKDSLERALKDAGLSDRVTFVQLDVTDPASIDAAVKSVLAATGNTLDAVVNNAGMAVAGVLEDIPEADIRRVIETNFFGVLALTRALLPTFRTQRHGRIVLVSSQAALAGYYAVLIGATNIARMLPMMTTAVGSIRPQRTLVMGLGVAGLQALATARRLGAMTEGYDVRPETKEQAESLGAKFVDTGVSAEGAGGYARELTEEEKRKQQEVLDQRIGVADVVITTAAVPGRTAPRIISRAAVERMKPGAVIVDIAAESGGNCELTRAGETVLHQGVKIVGPVNLPSQLAYHASEMYARNLLNFLKPAIDKGELKIDWNDEVFAQSCLTHEGRIRHEPTRKVVES